MPYPSSVSAFEIAVQTTGDARSGWFVLSIERLPYPLLAYEAVETLAYKVKRLSKFGLLYRPDG